MTSSPKKLRFLSFRTWPFLLKAVALLSLFVFLVATVTVLVVSVKYSRKASVYDLGKIDKLEEGALVVGKDQKEVGRILIEDRLFVSLDDVPQILKDAVVSTEDARFYEHNGYDLRGMVRSAVVNIKAGEIKQGASTITQQLARHAFKLRGKNFDRKLTEIFLARRISERYSKDEILERYLNRIYLGSGFYGVGTAARGYFGKSIEELSEAEAATLAGIIKSPANYSPFASEELATKVRNMTLGRMLATSKITQEKYDAAIAEPLVCLAAGERSERPDFALQATRREIQAQLPERIDLDRATISTSLDLDLTLTAIDSLRDALSQVENDDPSLPSDPDSRLEGAVVVLENQTGRILAAVGGRDHQTSPFDRAFNGSLSAGTAFLPITYAAYFAEHLQNPLQEILDAPLDNRSVMIGSDAGMLAEWGSQVEEFRGLIPAPYAFLRSKTSAAIRAGHAVGVDQVIKTARICGIESPLAELPSTFLGKNPVKLIELARAYATIANDGVTTPEPRFASGLTFGGGHYFPLFQSVATGTSLDVTAARLVREVMVARLREPMFDAVLSRHGISQHGLAGQPGSSYGFHDGWFIGSDQRITCAVWVGRNDGESLTIENPGLNLAMPIWAEVMATATAGRPTGWPLGLPEDQVCILSGRRISAACRKNPDSAFIHLRGLGGGKCSTCGGDHSPPPPKAILVQEKKFHRQQHVFIAPKEPAVLGDDPFKM
ncbi:transglycosylase domain-containing protein [bacterium]|nr:transglycosylase domain-containing protein [bacterium]